MKNCLRLMGLAAAMLLLGACSLFQNQMADPEVALVGLRVGPTDGLNQTVMVDLQITNPNSSELKLNAIQYRIRLEGRDLISGSSREPLEVPAGGVEKYTVPASISLLSGFSFIRDVISRPRDKIAYELSATLEPSGLFSLPFTVKKADSIALSR